MTANTPERQTDETLRAQIDDYGLAALDAQTPAVSVTIEADGDHAATFDDLRDAVNGILDPDADGTDVAIGGEGE